MRDISGTPLGPSRTTHVGPDGGGFVTSFGITDDGKAMVHGTDVGGGYVWGENDTQWRHAVTFDSYPEMGSLPIDPAYSDAGGAYAIDIAPSNSQIGYVVYGGWLFSTTDQFHTLTRRDLQARMKSNADDWRLYNDKLRIDPRDPLSFVLGTEGMGAFYSIDGGETVVKIEYFADVDTGGTTMHPINVAVDRTSAAINGRSSRWSVFVPGQGLFTTTSGVTAEWVLDADAPAMPVCDHMFYDAAGHLYMCSSAGSAIHKRDKDAGTWSVVTAFSARSLAVLGNGQKVAMDPNGAMRWTNRASPDFWDDGANFWPHFPLKGGISYKADVVHWLTNEQVQLFPSKLLADPVNPDKFWIVHGTGIAWCILPAVMGDTDASRIVFNDRSQGNAMLVTAKTKFTREGTLLRTSWDKPLWISRSDDEIASPLRYNPPVGVEHGWDVSTVPGRPDIINLLANYSNQWAGRTTDYGATYTKFGPHPAGFVIGGNLGFVTPDEGYWVPSNNARPVYTLNGGKTWQYLNLVGPNGEKAPTTGELGWSFAYYFDKQNLLVSEEEPGVAYLWNYGPEQATWMRGLWRKEAGSQTFVQVHQGAINGRIVDYYYHMALAEVPGSPGYLIMTTGTVDNAAAVSVFSRDRGATWESLRTSVDGGPVSTLTSVTALGFGKAAAGQAYPAIRFAGVVNGQKGVFETFDNFASSTFLEPHAMGLTQEVESISGDPLAFGKWVYGVGQLGWVRSDKKFEMRFS